MGPRAREERGEIESKMKKEEGSKKVSGQVGSTIHPPPILVNSPTPPRLVPSQTQSASGWRIQAPPSLLYPQELHLTSRSFNNEDH